MGAFNKRFGPSKWQLGLTADVLVCCVISLLTFLLGGMALFVDRGGIIGLLLISASFVAIGSAIKLHSSADIARIKYSINVGKTDLKRRSLEIG